MENAPAEQHVHDVGIIGGGPAGLSAGLLLGRCRRDVVIFDSGKPRNSVSRGLHGYLTRDGIPPWELRELGRRELAAYPSVQWRERTVVGASRTSVGFELRTQDNRVTRARILLLATGRDDELPDRPGFRALYGRGVYHCPFCDGWEHRDRPLVAYGRGIDTFEVARELLTWTRDVTLCSDGPCELDGDQRQRLAANGIRLNETPVSELRAAPDGTLECVCFTDGKSLPCGALFFVSNSPQKSHLPESLGCTLADSGGVQCDAHAATNVAGLFVAGNVRCGLHLAITAAAEGAEAAVAINDALIDLDLA
jgi:thioredoxin reductase